MVDNQIRFTGIEPSDAGLQGSSFADILRVREELQARRSQEYLEATRLSRSRDTMMYELGRSTPRIESETFSLNEARRANNELERQVSQAAGDPPRPSLPTVKADDMTRNYEIAMLRQGFSPTTGTVVPDLENAVFDVPGYGPDGHHLLEKLAGERSAASLDPRAGKPVTKESLRAMMSSGADLSKPADRQTGAQASRFAPPAPRASSLRAVPSPEETDIDSMKMDVKAPVRPVGGRAPSAGSVRVLPSVPEPGAPGSRFNAPTAQRAPLPVPQGDPANMLPNFDEWKAAKAAASGAQAEMDDATSVGRAVVSGFAGGAMGAASASKNLSHLDKFPELKKDAQRTGVAARFPELASDGDDQHRQSHAEGDLGR